MKIKVIFSREYEVDIINPNSNPIEMAFKQMDLELRYCTLTANSKDFYAEIKPLNRIEYVIETRETKDLILISALRDHYDLNLINKDQLIKIVCNHFQRYYMPFQPDEIEYVKNHIYLSTQIKNTI